jgi:hypothetical protein
MQTTPAIEAALRARLRQAIDDFAGGSADRFGRLLGYTNGGYLREVLSEKKPVRDAIIQRTHAVKEMVGWFDPILQGLPPGALLAGSGSRRDRLSDEAVEFACLYEQLNPQERARLRLLIMAARDGINPTHFPALPGLAKADIHPQIDSFDSGLGDLDDRPTPPHHRARHD